MLCAGENEQLVHHTSNTIGLRCEDRLGHRLPGYVRHVARRPFRSGLELPGKLVGGQPRVLVEV